MDDGVLSLSSYSRLKSRRPPSSSDRLLAPDAVFFGQILVEYRLEDGYSHILHVAWYILIIPVLSL